MLKQLTNQQQQILIIRISCFFWLFTKLLSYKLWHAERLFPLSPPFAFLEDIPNSIHLFLFGTAMLVIALLVVFPKNKIVMIVTIVIEFCSCMLDQNRWQPWEYQYFITVLFAFFYGKNPKQFVHYFAFMIVAIYVNSGLHKLNGGFLFQVWEGMMLREFMGFEMEQIRNSFVHYAGLSLGLIEVVSALGLLFFRKKKLWAALLIGMHIYILWFISPTGLNYNPIVWPWNLVMMIFIYLIFWNDHPPKIIFKDLVRKYNVIPFVFIGILPFFCMIGLYDNFLSFNLYSGSLKQLDICVGDTTKLKEYEPYFSDKKSFCKDGKVLNTNMWTLQEMNIVVYPEERIYFDIMKKWKQQHPDSKATFTIYEYPYTEGYVKHYD